MFNNGDFKCGIKMSEKYRDKYSGFEGVATGVYFYENGCIRVQLEGGKDGELKVEIFDDVRLVHVETKKEVKAPPAGRGGPRPSPARSTPTR